MAKSKLNELYDPENFRKTGLEIVNFLADYLHKSYLNELPTNSYKEPEEMLQSWRQFLNESHSSSNYYKKVVNESIHLHNPNYIGHQVGVTAPISALGGLISDLLSNGMAIYEMGSVSNALEHLAIEILNKSVGFENGGGFMTSGGTLANLTALLTARAAKVGDNIWENGYESKKYGIMVSSQAHYCIDRAARIMGLGSDGIIKLPVDQSFKVDNQRIEEEYFRAKEKGIQIFAIVASSCSTSTGSYDDITFFAEFAKKHEIWFHVDGAHGAAVTFSEKYKYLVEGINLADSAIIDCHKMFMTPTITTAVLYKNKLDSNKTFRQKAEYLFDESENFDWYNSGKRTFECTKLMMSIKFMSIVQQYGVQVFEENIDTLYDNTRVFAAIIRSNPNFELALKPQANIVCFRYQPDNISIEDLNDFNSAIRQRILEDGQHYIVQTLLDRQVYLRATIMNPKTAVEHFQSLLDKIVQIAQTLKLPLK